MSEQWTAWKALPRAGETVDAPAARGLYELRCVSTGAIVAFGESPNLAATLSNRRMLNLWKRIVGRWHGRSQHDLEYRALAVRSAKLPDKPARTVATRNPVWWTRAKSSS